MTDTPRTPHPAPPTSSQEGGAGSAAPYGSRELPARPALASANLPPVMVKATPPFSIRLSLFLWIVSFAVGAFTTVYMFVIRKDLLPEIVEVAKGVTAGRQDATYESAADIIFWVVFGLIVALLFVQITLLVSFMGRRPHIRWWQLLTLGLQGLLVLLSPEWVALGAQGKPLQPLLAAQAALVLLALLSSVLPGAIAWSARRFDVRRGPEGTGQPDL